MKKLYLVGVFILYWFSFSAISYAGPTDTPTGKFSNKTVILILHANGKAVTVKQTIVKDLPFHAKAVTESDRYHYTLLSKDNKVLYTAHFFNPLVRWVDDFSDPSNPKGGRETVAENEFALKIPYLIAAERIRFEKDDAVSGKRIPLGVSPLSLP